MPISRSSPASFTASACVKSRDGRGAGQRHRLYVFNPAFGHGAITDFAAHDEGASHDLISLPKTDFSSFAALSKAASNVGGNVVIAAQNGDRLTLDNLTVSALNGLAPDFKFH